MNRLIITFNAAVLGTTRVKKRLDLAIIYITNKKTFKTVESIIISMAS